MSFMLIKYFYIYKHIYNMIGVKMKKKLLKLSTIRSLFWSRTNPWPLNVYMLTFISIRKFILNCINKYVKEWNSVLDFGCWNMVYKKYFLSKIKWVSYSWLDIWQSPEFNKNYQIYPWWKIPHGNQSFDVVISTQVFEHLDDPRFYASELERITKKKWYIFLTIAHVWWYHPYPNHYQNIMYDLIPLIFSNSKIIEVKWDTSLFQNTMMFFMQRLENIGYFNYLFIFIINGLFLFFDMIWISKIQPVKYNPYAWNILLVLQVL